MSDHSEIGKVEEEKEAAKYKAWEEVDEYTTTRDGGLRN